MQNERLFKYALCGLPILLGIIIIREIPIAYASSDYYYYERIFFDFFEQGSTWGEMYFGPAPGFFTNMLPLAIISQFVDHLTRIYLFHIVLYGMITMALIWYLARSVTRNNLASIAAIALAILLIIMVGAENSFWNRPSHHYGSVINLLLAMALMVTGMGSSKATAWLYLVVVLTVISDFLYIPMYLAMTGGVLLVYWLSGEAPFRKGVMKGLLLVTPVLIGVLLHYLITPNVVANPVWASGLSLREVLLSPSVHLKALRFLIVEGTRLPIYGLSAAVGLFAWWTTRKQYAEARIFLYYLVAMQCVIWGNIYMSGLGDSAVVRYRLFAVNGACVLLGISFALLTFKASKLAALPWGMLAAVYLLGTGYLLWPDQQTIEYQHKQDRRYFNLLNQVECVRKIVVANKLSAGISEIKDANPYTVLSKGEVFLYPVAGKSVKPLNWLVSGVGLKREFDYALVTRGIKDNYYDVQRAYYQLSRSVVEDVYGVPKDSFRCDDKEILIYSQIDFGTAAE